MTNCTRAEKSKFIGQELLAVQFLERREDVRYQNIVAASSSGQSVSIIPPLFQPQRPN